jgi:hypothetical protein
LLGIASQLPTAAIMDLDEMLRDGKEIKTKTNKNVRAY